jgi:hypothetical protein
MVNLLLPLLGDGSFPQTANILSKGMPKPAQARMAARGAIHPQLFAKSRTILPAFGSGRLLVMFSQAEHSANHQPQEATMTTHQSTHQIMFGEVECVTLKLPVSRRLSIVP